MNDDDFFGGIEEHSPSADSSANRMRSLVKEHQEKSEELHSLSAVIEGLKTRIREIEEQDAPDTLKELGTDIWRDEKTNLTVKLEDRVGGLPVLQNKEEQARRRATVINALRPLGIDSILTQELSLSFRPGDEMALVFRRLFMLEEEELIEGMLPQQERRLSNSQVEAIENFLSELGITSLPASEQVGAHPSTLKKWLKEKIAAGHGNEISEAGIYHGKGASIAAGKPKRGAK